MQTIQKLSSEFTYIIVQFIVSITVIFIWNYNLCIFVVSISLEIIMDWSEREWKDYSSRSIRSTVLPNPKRYRRWDWSLLTTLSDLLSMLLRYSSDNTIYVSSAFLGVRSSSWIDLKGSGKIVYVVTSNQRYFYIQTI